MRSLAKSNGSHLKRWSSTCFVHARCLPVLLYGVESCPLLVRDKRSLDFTVTRSFMKLLRTGSAAVVDECQKFFRFLPPGLLSPLYWTGLTLLNGFSFLVIFYFFFILGRAVN